MRRRRSWERGLEHKRTMGGPIADYSCLVASRDRKCLGQASGIWRRQHADGPRHFR